MFILSDRNRTALRDTDSQSSTSLLSDASYELGFNSHDKSQSKPNIWKAKVDNDFKVTREIESPSRRVSPRANELSPLAPSRTKGAKTAALSRQISDSEIRKNVVNQLVLARTCQDELRGFITQCGNNAISGFWSRYARRYVYSSFLTVFA